MKYLPEERLFLIPRAELGPKSAVFLARLLLQLKKLLTTMTTFPPLSSDEADFECCCCSLFSWAARLAFWASTAEHLKKRGGGTIFHSIFMGNREKCNLPGLVVRQLRVQRVHLPLQAVHVLLLLAARFLRRDLGRKGKNMLENKSRFGAKGLCLIRNQV